jgi:hypothetical protein
MNAPSLQGAMHRLSIGYSRQVPLRSLGTTLPAGTQDSSPDQLYHGVVFVDFALEENARDEPKSPARAEPVRNFLRLIIASTPCVANQT